ncbi:MAG: hypothetical protein U0441_04635 [Polyangiaceae bacterium]
MRIRFTIASILLSGTLSALGGCDSDGPPPPPEIPATDKPRMEPPAAPPTASASATDTAATTAGAADWAVLAGAWEGSYDAKKGTVEMPAGVKDPARAADDGKVASGAGVVKIVVTPDGDVTGQSDGALGKASIRGKMDGKMLRAQFVPDDPTAKTAMTGVLVGPLKEGVVQAELRVAGTDALVVRQANFTIKKK